MNAGLNMFNRRAFIGASAAVIASACASKSVTTSKRIAITVDDFDLSFDRRLDPLARNAAIFDAFDAHRHKAAGFVTGRMTDSPLGATVIQSWSDAGHMLANHSYSHLNSTETPAAVIKADILKNHMFMQDTAGYEPLFRFPFLAEGGTMDKVNDYRAFLDEYGFKIAPISVDSIDWFITARMEARLADAPEADTSAYRDYYIKSVLEIAAYKHELALALGLSDFPHIMLMHHNILNGLYLRDVMDALVADGWSFVDAKDAFAHPLYAHRAAVPTRGRSHLSVVAQERGVADDGFPAAYYGFGEKTMDALGL